MCLIFVKPKGAEAIPKFWTQEVWRTNHDGWGISWNNPTTGRVTHHKGLTFEGFWRVLQSLQVSGVGISSDIMCHMRMATQGGVTKDNLHPYVIETPRSPILLCHNGHVDFPDEYDGFESTTDDRDSSDTKLFVDRMLKPIFKNHVKPSELIRDKGFLYLLERHTGSYSNYAIHDDEGVFLLPNSSWFKTTTGIITSNEHSYKSLKPESEMKIVGTS